MANAVSLFSRLLRHFPRTEFAFLVKKHGAERHAKGFACWDRFIAMLFRHLARGHVRAGFAAAFPVAWASWRISAWEGLRSDRRRPLPTSTAPPRFTRTCSGRPWSGSGARGRLGKTGFRFRNKLPSLDSTTVSSCLNLFPWAGFRRAKGGVKVHVMLDHADYMPSFVLITEGPAPRRRGGRENPPRTGLPRCHGPGLQRL